MGECIFKSMFRFRLSSGKVRLRPCGAGEKAVGAKFPEALMNIAALLKSASEEVAIVLLTGKKVPVVLPPELALWY